MGYQYILMLMLTIFFYGCNTQSIKSDLKIFVDIDRTAPILTFDKQTHNTKNKNNTAVISFNSNEGGILVYDKDCKSNTKKAYIGKNQISFENLADGFYNFCTVSIVDAAGNLSRTIKVPSFTIKKSNKPILLEITPIASDTYDNTPNYIFRSSSDGSISYLGSCKSLQNEVKIGNNVITFEKLENGYYQDCAIFVTNQDGYISNELKITSFSINSNKDFKTVDQLKPKRLATLDKSIKESSGLLYIDGKLYTHNDSNSKAEIYEIDNYGQIVRTISINGATNIDWEGMTQDKSYIYIADIGNNKGNRKDLKIYKIDKKKFLKNDSVECGVIKIKYGDQDNFDYKQFFTPYDAESIISYQDNLYIFTKNWEDKVTRVYPVSKKEGSYTLDSISSYAYDFLVTDATYNTQADQIILIGYSSFLMSTQKISILGDFYADDFFSGNIQEIEINSNLLGFKQIEAVTNDGAEKIYITSEDITNKYIGNHPSSLFELEIFK